MLQMEAALDRHAHVDAIVSIGEWQVDPHANTLRRDTEMVRVEPKAMDVLMLLARHPGRVVPREQILATVWSGVVVGDEVVSQSIIKLRRALRDPSRTPRYIETIAKRGYRLVAPVGPAAAGPTTPAAGARVARPWLAVRPGVRLVVAALAGVAAAGAVLVTVIRDTPTQERAVTPSAFATAPVQVAMEPFATPLPDSGDAYLARGIGDELAGALARISTLRVIRISPNTPWGVGRYRVRGSVERDGGTLRIQVRLMDGGSGAEIWSERFVRPTGELFEAQDALVSSLTHRLPAEVSQAERRRMAERYTPSLAAYDDFLRAQALFLARTEVDNTQAREWYRSAIARDPQFARAYAGLAMTYALEPRWSEPERAAQSLARGLQLAQTAREIDPSLPEVYWASGFVHAQRRAHAEAMAALEHAIALDPSFADAYALLGGIHTYLGEPARSIPLLREAMRLRPDAGYLYFLLLGRAYLLTGDVEQAVINLRAAAQRNPVDLETRAFLAGALVAAGDRAGAGWEADEIRSLEPDFSVARWLDGYPMTRGAHRDRLAALVRAALE